MFERLDCIPWAELRQAHGDAGHVPAAVRALISGDSAEARRAYWRLDNYVVLQGDLYEAAAYLPELLVEALDLALPEGRHHILDLLFEIGNGYASPEVRLRFAVGNDGRLRNYAPETAPTLSEVCRGTTRTALAAYLTAGRGDDEAREGVTAVLRDLLAGGD